MQHYRKIWESINGPIPIDEFGKTYEIHHIDGNHKNNSVDNLQCISIKDHYDIHNSQGDLGACYLIGIRMQLSTEELSMLSSLVQQEKIKNKTHAFLRKDFQKNMQNKRVADGVHPWQNSELQKKKALMRVENGTHPWLGLELATKNNLKRIKDNTHNFLGDTNPGKLAFEAGTSHINNKEWQKEKAKKQLEKGTHNSQVKWVCSNCNKEGKGSGAFSRFHGNNCKYLVVA